MARPPHTFRPHQDREERTARLVANLRHVRNARERDSIALQLIEVNLPLCDALASRYASRGADLDDLKQVARTALVSAVRHYRPDEGPSLTAFAVPTITGELKRYFRDRCWMVRPPRALQELRPTAVRARDELEQKLGRTASNREVAAQIGVDDRTLDEALWTHGGYRPASIDAPLPGALSDTLGSQLGSGEDIAEAVVERVSLQTALRELPERDLRVLRWRFDDDLTQSEIAERLGVSQMQVSRILRRILTVLRTHLNPEDDVPAQILAYPRSARPADHPTAA